MAGLAWDRREPVWLVDYDVNGRIFRFGSEQADVTNAAADTFRYLSGLDALTLGSVRSLGRVETTLRIHSGEDWAQLVSRGAQLNGRAVVVRLWYPGDTLEQARIYIEGETQGARFGELGEPLTLGVVEDPAHRAQLLPPDQAQATDETWPVNANVALSTAAVGQPIPILIGYPGDHPKAGASVDIAEAAFRMPYVERQDPYTNGTGDLYAAAFGKINAAKLQLYDYEGNTASFAAASPATAVTVDLLGQSITTITHSFLAMPETGEVWGGLRNASTWGGGTLSPYTGGVLRGAGEVMRYMLDYFGGQRIDRGRVLANQDWFDRFKVDAVIHERRNAIDWLTTNVLAYLPALAVDGPEGLYFAPLRWDATALDSVAHLDADRRQVTRTTDPKIWREKVLNAFTLDYRPVRNGERWASRRVMTSIAGNLYEATTSGANLPPFSTSLPWMATTESDARVFGSSVCQWSQSQSWGIREWEGQHPACWDDATAALVLYYKALRNAWPKRLISYRGGMELKSLEPGDVVTVTETALRLAGEVAIVLERRTSTSSIDLDLVLLEHPLRRARATS